MSDRTQQMRRRMAEVDRELELLRKKKRMLEKDYSRAAEDLEETASAPSVIDVPLSGAEKNTSPKGDPTEGLYPRGEESRERFASYFMTGGLGRSGPQLRREKRVMRNRAIIAAIVAALLLYALVHFLVRA